ncbi:cytochrome c1 [Legionella shakespearei]|uniref:Ubiquinol-cytochrome c reductase cytochrome c1 subunit n=1 Tax=Legionella shakespearei DSM 23087 TaxID=1122169 RepID=A0A0W0YSU6_9GAMM|nr:ubiquinol-cytochrome c reductase cytochrome c1 subunit [Legionella shakespearei DSM 23087]
MKMMRLIVIALYLLAPSLEAASTNEFVMQTVSVDIRDKERLQRGASLFMNYCSGCHSLKYMRYNRMAKDLGLTTFDGRLDEDLLKNNLIFTQATINDPIQIAMLPTDAKEWFGIVPPDLSLTARERGTTWIYNYLKSFYSDDARPFGSNNLLVPDVAMPNVLEPLIGKMVLNPNHKTSDASLLLIKPGEMYPAQFDSAIQDLVTFLAYVGEPAQLVRYRLGGFVIAFLFIFLIVAYRLKKNYWQQLKKVE